MHVHGCPVHRLAPDLQRVSTASLWPRIAMPIVLRPAGRSAGSIPRRGKAARVLLSRSDPACCCCCCADWGRTVHPLCLWCLLAARRRDPATPRRRDAAPLAGWTQGIAQGCRGPDARPRRLDALLLRDAPRRPAIHKLERPRPSLAVALGVVKQFYAGSVKPCSRESSCWRSWGRPGD